MKLPGEHSLRRAGCLLFDRKISPGFPKDNGKQFIILMQNSHSWLVTVSSPLMSNEDQGCRHVAISPELSLALNTKGQIFKCTL